MAKQLFANNVSVTINEFLSATDTTITVSSTASFPAISGGDWIMATIVPQGGQGSREVVKITAISGNNLTVVRGLEGTTGQSFLFGSVLELRVTKDSLANFTQGPTRNSITELKALDKNVHHYAHITGYYASGDGGGGQYWLDISDTTSADNGGSTIVANDGGRWKLIVEDTVSVHQFGAKADGTTDDTASFNSAILAASLAKANVLSQDETYSVEVFCKAGKDYKINGPVLIPSGIVLQGNGSRLIGNFSNAENTAYSDAASSVIETGHYSGGAITTNRAANSTTQRVVGAGIKNLTIINANAGLNLINFQERSYVENLNFSNVSAAIRMKSCYYSKYKRVVVRNSSKAANQYALLMHGVDNSSILLEGVTVVNAVRGLQVDSNPSSGVVIQNCSFEGAYVTNGAGTVDGVGIYFGATSAQNGWRISDCYFEAIRWGMRWIAGAASYGIGIANNFFTNTEYAALSAASAVRVGKWYSNSHSDGGGIIRNLVDFSTTGNEIDVQLQVKIGQSPTTTSAFLTNILLGNRGSSDTYSFWNDTAVAGGLIARTTGSRANLSALGDFQWEGAHMITKNLQVPFVSQTITGASITLDSQITFDTSNMLCCHIVISDFVGGPYTFDALIFGSTVYPLVAFSAGKTLTISNNAGNVRFVFGGLNTNAGANYAIEGGVRHL